MADLSDSIALIINQKLKFMIVIIRIPLQKKKKKHIVVQKKNHLLDTNFHIFDS